MCTLIKMAILNIGTTVAQVNVTIFPPLKLHVYIIEVTGILMLE